MKQDSGPADRTLDELYAQLQARTSSGNYRLANDEVADLLGCLVLASLAAGSSDPITRDEEALLMRLHGRLDRLVIDPSVLATLRETARALLTASAAPRPAQQRLLGSGKPLQPLVQPKRPHGTVRAGPAARFQLDAKGIASGRKKRQKSAARNSKRKGNG